MAKLSSCDTDHLTQKAESIYYLTFIEKFSQLWSRMNCWCSWSPIRWTSVPDWEKLSLELN